MTKGHLMVTRRAMSFLVGFVVGLFAALGLVNGGAEVHAQVSAEAKGGASNLSHGGAIAVSYQTSAKTQWRGALSAFGLRTGFIDGFAVSDGLETRATVGAEHLVGRFGPLKLIFGWGTGAAMVTTTEELDEQTAILGVAELSLVGEVAASERMVLRLGTRVPVDVALAPSIDLATVGAATVAETSYRVRDELDLFLGAEAGGLFGYGGDGKKWEASALIGIRWIPNREAATQKPLSSTEGATSHGSRAFVNVGWRLLNLADHLSHGPSFEAGVRLGRLKLGIAGFARPGPINPKTFATTPANGLMYRGKSQLDLRSDGAFIGALIAPVFDVGDLLSIEMPVTVGQSAFGFYLSGQDRETPDGRRVSDWENELLDGRDSSIGIGVDGGLRASVALTRSKWIAASASVHYLQTFGYDAFVRDNYNGVSGSLGLQLSVP